MPTSHPPPPEVEAFLAAQPPDRRAALEDLRAKILASAPEATEAIGYGVPAFKLRGRPLVSYGAGKDHCSFYVQSPAVMEAHAGELAGYRTSKGTVHFAPSDPLPPELVATLVRARMAEIG
jgi:uncharacterized protein YdhG (YjbR/CyaY superfamily)